MFDSRLTVVPPEQGLSSPRVTAVSTAGASPTGFRLGFRTVRFGACRRSEYSSFFSGSFEIGCCDAADGGSMTDPESGGKERVFAEDLPFLDVDREQKGKN